MFAFRKLAPVKSLACNCLPVRFVPSKFALVATAELAEKLLKFNDLKSTPGPNAPEIR